uniref:CID domain-containing protein n=1 Tax=Eutreptiella gymnastica TaxID=73025 RepID=A0A7S4CHE5_9EUGL
MSAISCVVCEMVASAADTFTKPTSGCNHQYCEDCVRELVQEKKFPPLICCEDSLHVEKMKLLEKAEKSGKHKSTDTHKPRQDASEAATAAAAKADAGAALKDTPLDKAQVAEYYDRLAELRTASKFKVQVFTQVAGDMLRKNLWREAAYAVSKRIAMAPAEHKIGAWCLMDSIVRFDQSKVYQKEFMKHVPKLLSKYAPEGTDASAQFTRLVARWQREKIFPQDVFRHYKEVQVQPKS